MKAFELHDLASAPDASRGLLEEVEQRFGFVPNIYRVMAASPALLQSYVGASGAFAASSLTATEQQIVLLTVSAANGCAYCVAAHSTAADMGGLPAAITDAIRGGEPLPDAKLEALRHFVEAVVNHRGWASDELEAFLEAGYSPRAVLDVITGVGMKTLSNYMNHLAGTPLDEAFEKRRWQKESV